MERSLINHCDSSKSSTRRPQIPPRQATQQERHCSGPSSPASSFPRRRKPQEDYDADSPPRLQRRLPRISVTRRAWTMLLLLSAFDRGTSNLRALGQQQQQDPTTLNGGSILAMAGRDCVAVAVDRRFGSGPALVNVPSGRSLLLPSDRVLVAFTGLQSDVESLQQELLSLVTAKYGTGIAIDARDTRSTSSNDRNQKSSPRRSRSSSSSMMISPRSMASLTSHVLYGRRRAPYYVEPIVVGLEEEAGYRPSDDDESLIPDIATSSKSSTDEVTTDQAQAQSSSSFGRTYRPYLCSMDVIGATSVATDFACGGAAASSLYGTAEAFWKPNLSRDELLAVIAKAFVAALERDCLSGYGALVYLVTADGVTEYDISTRND